MANRTATDTILSDYQDREHGEVIRHSNITACCIVADAVRSTLGPNGRDKLLIHKTYDISGEFLVTNDGATILDEMKLEHPAAKMVAEIGQEQDEQIGDGTTTSTAFGGELLRQASTLIENGLHPGTIVRGYHLAGERARTRLDDFTFDVSTTDTEMLRSIAETSLAGRVTDDTAELLAELIVRGLVQTGGDELDPDSLQVLPVKGKPVGDSELTDGLLLDKSLPSPNLPEERTDATVAVVDGSISLDRGQYKRHRVTDPEDAVRAVDTPDEIDAFIEQREHRAKEQIQKYVDAGVDAIVPVGFVDNKPLYYLSKEGIMALRQVDPDDLKKVAAATDANIVGEVDDLEQGDLGTAARIREVTVGTEERMLIENPDHERSVTLLLRSSTEQTLEELERAVDDAIDVVCSIATDGRAVAGAGATELELVSTLREYATTITTREQLVIEAYADALEMIPRTLARNAGADPLDTMIRLRNEHDGGNSTAGVLADGTVGNAREDGVVEPLCVKQGTIRSATEVATQLLRIDGIIATEPLSQEEEDEYAQRVERGEDPEEAQENVRP